MFKRSLVSDQLHYALGRLGRVVLGSRLRRLPPPLLFPIRAALRPCGSRMHEPVRRPGTAESWRRPPSGRMKASLSHQRGRPALAWRPQRLRRAHGTAPPPRGRPPRRLSPPRRSGRAVNNPEGGGRGTSRRWECPSVVHCERPVVWLAPGWPAGGGGAAPHSSGGGGSMRPAAQCGLVAMDAS